MPMTGPTFSANVLTGFTSAGFIGTSSPLLANAIGNGSMLEIIGKPFNTTDTGTGPGTGIGTGVGLTGILGPAVSSQIQQEIVISTGNPPTPEMIKMCNKIGDAFAQEVALATLLTNHAPVFAGTATITPGSIAVVGGSVGSSINNFGSAFIGKDWPKISKAIGNALGNSFATANAIITIVVTSTTPPTAPAGPIPNTVTPAGVLS